MLIKAFLTAFAFQIVLARPNYYWRPFNREVPSDAVNATDMVNGNNQSLPDIIYICRGPYRDNGEEVGEILPGIASLTISVPGLFSSSIVTITEHLEILCSDDSSNFLWLDASYESLESVARKVEGGFETSDNGVLYIGKALYSNTGERVGKINGYDMHRNQP